MARIELLSATTRTATVAFRAAECRYFLDVAVNWRLEDMRGAFVSEGRCETVIFTLVGLDPDSDYSLVLGEERLDFRTATESLLVDIAYAGAISGGEDNTAVIQAAIDALPVNGTLRIPPGDWYSGPLFLKSHMTLLLERGASLMGLASRAHYPILEARHPDGRVLGTWEGVAEACFASLITAIDCTCLTITGEGIIDGGGDRGDWWTWPKERRDNARRPRTIFISGGENAVLSGITVRNSPSWTIHPVLTNHFLAAGLTIENDPDSPNTDGLNPECCRDVALMGIRFSVGDDCIAIKAGKRDPLGGLDQPCENIIIENCLMERGHGGVVIGSEMSGHVRNVQVRRCHLQNTDRGLRIKTRRGRGGRVENIALDDCTMDGVFTPLAVNCFYFCDADGRSEYVQSRQLQQVNETTPFISGITLRNVIAENVSVAAAAIYGLPEAPVENVTIENYRVTYNPQAVADIPVMACGIDPVRHGGIMSEHAVFLKKAGIVLPSTIQSIAV